MPELPEVEVIKQLIKKELQNTIISFAIVRTNKLRYNIPDEISTINNQKIIDIKRKGRYIILILLYNTIIIHLGMTGNLIIFKTNLIAPTKHDHIDLIINNNWILRYNDPRKFGFWLWETQYYIQNNFLQKLGIEPLHDKFNAFYLYQKTKYSKMPIKVLLMTNSIVTGIGNIYANEILFFSKILPFRKSNSLCYNEVKLVVIYTKKILMKSIKYGGTTISNYKQPNQNIGKFTQYLCIYNKAKQLCCKCQKNIIQKILQRNRSSFFCIYCQK
ncbi:bifunctional DNA-formamidopyrimidine glycosylase/DNA-(apurinic or apyrimidinic site) lyase [Enterobacteriaceae endosymbiont of Macroplea mutica]|uniref:bifunctional DNA-formamidopyrimidine glycosylase/DNA-(apurinic or apyrimidinic site) lyase n=1 Tax=Enterobacteriaceae endosymbiont of Macroplea mutica TaxID=2675791 RepID=UPI0014499120|nr:bifunctional DNA-formamidopyrimidine glycosylase/DNA-(apurinic or apyrimidinic site) lyase [Enterobacteriaceae endosymbiont of Macroplea mutica]QJC31426.1 bifunctional DNA-formamidopyrimidine glycosylase/DNA-(apurinic or apyrimidinic site) lyase [Enterobacteriaceae endosymbiont of Macroplea mutica]